jgi:hypothetical protein
VLDVTIAKSLELLRTLFAQCGKRDVEWVVKEGGVLGVIRIVMEKEERNGDVMCYVCWAAARFLYPRTGQIRRLRNEWKGKKEWREVMWMMEEEGGIDSMCGRKEAYGGFKAQEVLKLLGICCAK